MSTPEAEWPTSDSRIDATWSKHLSAQPLGVEIKAGFAPGFLSWLGWLSLRRAPTTTR